MDANALAFFGGESSEGQIVERNETIEHAA